jgi:hypothetical protein
VIVGGPLTVVSVSVAVGDPKAALNQAPPGAIMSIVIR